MTEMNYPIEVLREKKKLIFNEEVKDQLQKAIEILQGEVVAEGVVRYEMYTYKVYIGDKELDDIRENLSEVLEDYKGQSVKILLVKGE